MWPKHFLQQGINFLPDDLEGKHGSSQQGRRGEHRLAFPSPPTLRQFLDFKVLGRSFWWFAPKFWTGSIPLSFWGGHFGCSKIPDLTHSGSEKKKTTPLNPSTPVAGGERCGCAPPGTEPVGSQNTPTARKPRNSANALLANPQSGLFWGPFVFH